MKKAKINPNVRTSSYLDKIRKLTQELGDLAREGYCKDPACKECGEILEESPVGIMVVDHRGTMLMVNKLITKFFGYSRRELLGQKVEMLVPIGKKTVHKTHVKNFFEKNIIRYLGEAKGIYGRHKNGTLLHIDLAINTYEINGNLHGVAVINLMKDD